MKCEIGSKSDDVACSHDAEHVAHDWGYGPGSDETQVCASHAREAIRDGVTVTNDDGDDMALDDDGDLVPAGADNSEDLSPVEREQFVGWR